MNFNTIRTGAVGLMMAATPMANKATAQVAHNAKPAIEVVENVGGKVAQKMAKPQHAFGEVSVSYGQNNVLGITHSEPSVKVGMNAVSDQLFSFRPSARFGTQTFEIDPLPLNLRGKIAPNTYAEGGFDLFRVKGAYKSDAVFKSDLAAAMAPESKCPKVPTVRGDVTNSVNAGVRYTNATVDAGVRGEAGFRFYHNGTVKVKGNGPTVNAYSVPADVKVIDDMPSKFVGARADVKVAPLKNKNVYIAGDAAVRTGERPEFNVGIGARF